MNNEELMIPLSFLAVKTFESNNPMVQKYPSGNMQLVVYYNSDIRIHRETEQGPAFATFYPNGNCACLCFYIDGMLHRLPNSYEDIFDAEDTQYGPAMTSWYENGALKYKGCFVYNRLNDVNLDNGEIKPAECYWYKNGNKMCENYYTDNTKYKSIKWYHNGNMKYKECRLNGVLHGNPAIMRCYDTGSIQSQECWIMGKLISIKYFPNQI